MWRSSALAAASALRLEVLGVRHLIQLGLISITSRARSCAICCSDVLCRRWLQRASRSSSDHGLPALIVGKPFLAAASRANRSFAQAGRLLAHGLFIGEGLSHRLLTLATTWFFLNAASARARAVSGSFALNLMSFCT
jgi:hypothetical protein